ncbi:MAG: MutS-related protein [Stellaceae bacterium]
MISAGLGKGLSGAGHVLRKPNADDRPWLRRLLAKGPAAHTFHIAERDEAGARAVGELRDRGISIAANAAAQSCDHILGFFRMLRAELAFYVGCLNLHDCLAAKREPVCFAAPVACAQRRFAVRGLYDVCLALSIEHRVVGNDLDGDGKGLFMITGANRGGKSTLLRSVGLAQLMMQCGMFVGARSYRANLCTGLFTHHKREEDPTMRSGKFEEELAGVSAIADRLAPDCLMLVNESFQSIVRSRCSLSSTCSISPAGSMTRRSTMPYSCAPSGGRTGPGPSSCFQARRCEPATGRICTGTSSPPRPPTRRAPANRAGANRTGRRSSAPA